MSFRVGAATLLLGAALGACIYSFSNPVTAQSSGTVAGQVVLGTAAAGQSLVGAKVDLLWSNLSITLGTQGNFTFLDLPAGTYRLNVTVPPPAGSPNDFPIELSRGQIYLPQTSAGPDALALGPLTLDLAGTVTGTVSGVSLGDGGAVVGAFAPDPPDGGVGEYEGYSTTTDATGAFSLTLPAGTHQIWASTATESGSVVETVKAGQSATAQSVTLATPAGGSTADLVGYAVVGDYGASASVSQLQSLLGDGGLSIGLLPAGGVPSASFAFETPAPAAGVTGLQVDQQLSPGKLYQVSVGPPTSLGTSQIVPANLENIPAIAGRATFLQQIFLFSVATVAANQATPDAGTSGGTGTSSGGSGGGFGPALLVDNDGNTPPNGSADPSNGFFTNWLNNTSVTYSTYLEPDDSSDLTDVDKTNPTLAGINTIVFFTGDNLAPMSASQEVTLQNWLNQGGHTLILFSPALVYGIGDGLGWTSNETNAFLTQVVGATADLDNPPVWSAAAASDGPINNNSSTVVSGSAAVQAFATQQWTATIGVSTVSSFFSIISQMAGVEVLATVLADPTSAGMNLPEPVAIGRKHIGTAGTSTVVWVGFSVEDIQPLLAGFGTLQTFLADVQAYVGLP